MDRIAPSAYQSVERALGLLGAMVHRPPMRVTDLAKALGMGQSTVSRLLATLETAGCVRRDERTGLYELGDQVITLGGAALNQRPIHVAARQITYNLSCALGLGVNVAERRGGSLFYLANFDGRDAPKSHTLVGQRNPLYATAAGHALISELSPDGVRELIPPDALIPHTASTVRTHEELRARLERVRQRGWATENGELTLGRGCVAAPIRDSTGTIVAAISLSGPLSAVRLDEREEELARSVIEAAEAISTGLGYVPAYRAVAYVR